MSEQATKAKITHPADRPPLECRAVDEMAPKTFTHVQLRAAVDGWLCGYAAGEQDRADLLAACKAAYAECDAWRSAMQGAKLDNIMGMSEKDATCVVADSHRAAIAKTKATRKPAEAHGED